MIFWLVLKLEISYNKSYDILKGKLVSFKEFFLRISIILHGEIYLNFHNSSFALI